MKTKQVRELQVSSSQLALIFLAILGVAIIIFLLGVSIGKKYVETQPKAVSENKILFSENLAEKKGEASLLIPEKKLTSEPTSKEIFEPKKVTEIVPLEKSTKEEKKALEPEQKVTPVPYTKKLTSRAYFVQVGAFARKEATTKLVHDLKKVGYQSIILNPLPTDRTPLYRVRIGPFSSQTEAEAAKNRVRSLIPAAAKAFIVY
ncbi:MAG: SPOR domain-containing protein [Candidatus Aminicenantes bacterium]|nr:SPOR domain-containing protein [Candidatus Aminicenantes bacterium]